MSLRTRLFEVEDRLRKTNPRKSSEAVGGVPRSWMEKAQKLSRELDHYKQESSRLDTENEKLSKESYRLQAEHRSHFDDLQYLESQMTQLKHENSSLTNSLEQAAAVSMRNFLQLGMTYVESSTKQSLDESTSVHPNATDTLSDYRLLVERPDRAASREDLDHALKQSARLREGMTRFACARACVHSCVFTYVDTPLCLLCACICASQQAHLYARREREEKGHSMRTPIIDRGRCLRRCEGSVSLAL